MTPRSFFALALALSLAGAGLIWLRLIDAQARMQMQQAYYRWN